jgi:hypothetical protein
MGSVPITAGPTMPIATIDDASLSVIPGQRWRVVLYLNNNSAGTINPAIDCRSPTPAGPWRRYAPTFLTSRPARASASLSTARKPTCSSIVPSVGLPHRRRSSCRLIPPHCFVRHPDAIGRPLGRSGGPHSHRVRMHSPRFGRLEYKSVSELAERKGADEPDHPTITTPFT